MAVDCKEYESAKTRGALTVGFSRSCSLACSGQGYSSGALEKRTETSAWTMYYDGMVDYICSYILGNER